MHHQPRRRRQVVECVIDRVEALAIGDALEVVEHDGERRAERRDAVRQLDHGALEGMPGSLQPLQRTAAEAAAHAFDRHGHVGPEPHRVVVGGLERQPGDAARSALAPRAGGYRLPISRGSRDECERHVVPLENLLDSWARDHLGAQSRQKQLRLGNRKRLESGEARHRRAGAEGSRCGRAVEGATRHVPRACTTGMPTEHEPNTPILRDREAIEPPVP